MAAINRVLSESWPLMDEYLDGRISKSEYLSGYINFFRNNFKRDYPYIGEWIENQAGFITMIAEEANPEICMEYQNTGLLGMKAIESYAGNPLRDIDRQKNIPYHWAILARIMYEGFDSDLKRFIDESGPIMPYLGYFTLHAVALEWVNINSRKNKTIAPLLLRHDNDPRSSDFIGRFHFVFGKHGSEPYPKGGALGDMFKYAYADFVSRNNTPVDSSIAADINYHIGVRVAESVPADPWDAMIEAMKGNDNMDMNKLIRRAVDDKIKEYNREQKRRKTEKDKTESFIWGWHEPKRTEKDKECDLFNSLESMESIGELIKDTKDTIDGDIINQRLHDDELSLRDLEEKVNKSRNAISYRLKNLREKYIIEPK